MWLQLETDVSTEEISIFFKGGGPIYLTREEPLSEPEGTALGSAAG